MAARANIAKLVTPAHRLAALVFTDIVNSVQLKTRLRGSYLALLERHNELFEAGISESPSAEIIKHTGDGYFASFATASDAVHFALLFQARLKLEPWPAEKIEVRLGIHIGEVVMVDMAGRKDIVGLSADVAARLMSLAVGGQILLTETAFNDARQYVNSCPDILGDTPPLKWMAHGQYLCQGTDEPLDVYEVGVEKFFPLKMPADSEKVKRVVPHDQEPTLGWRPAMSLPVPGRPGWQLLRKLGEGGFGEVWLGEHQRLKEWRVFKFCFDTERLRGLKREYMLFRLLREALGRRPDIAALYEVKLDEPPFFLESEYSPGGNLLDWAQSQGGIQKLELKVRIDILAKVADALAAAHSVGVIHKDIKPSNILISQTADGQINPQLADFGISAILDRSRLKAHNVTETGFTEMQSASNTSFGTRMYLPPESTRDAIFTMRGDIYALGVMLYQFAVGDLLRPLGSGWERDIADPIMRRDIAAIVEGDPERRIGSASEVSRLLRTQDVRREEMAKAEKDATTRARRRRMRRATATVAVVVLVLCGIGLVQEWINNRKLKEEQARTQEEHAKSLAATKLLLGFINSADPSNNKQSAEKLILDASNQLDTAFSAAPEVDAEVQMCLADVLRNFGDSQAIDHYSKAAALYKRLYGDSNPMTLKARCGQAWAMIRANQNQDAQTILEDVIQKEKQLSGPSNRDALFAELLYAGTVYNLSGPKSAEPKFKEALDQRVTAFGGNDKDSIQSISAYATVLRDMGNLSDARTYAKQALDWRSTNFGPESFDTLPSLLGYGSILVDIGDPRDAADALKMLKTVKDQRERLDPGATKQDTLRAYAAYADALSASQRYAEAGPLYETAITWYSARDKALHSKPKDNVTAQCGYAELLTATGHADKALPLAKDAFETCSANEVAGPRLTVRAECAYVDAMAKLNLPGADARYKDLLERCQVFGADNPITRRCTKAYQEFASLGGTRTAIKSP